MRRLALLLVLALATTGCRDLDRLLERIETAEPSSVYTALGGEPQVAEMLSLIKYAREDLHYRVMTQELHGAVGLTNIAYRVIVLDHRLSVNSSLCVLAHEIAHVLQPSELLLVQEPDVREAFAEATAFLVCTNLGLGDVDQSAAFLKLYENATDTIRHYRPRIVATAKQILEGLKRNRIHLTTTARPIAGAEESESDDRP